MGKIWILVVTILLFGTGLSVSMPDKSVILAGEVEAKIRACEPAEFDNRHIIGDLNLSGLTISGLVHFENTIFRDSVNFNHTFFNGNAFFHGSKFNSTAYFSGSEFNSDAYFNYSVFKGDADFDYASFNGTADFQNSKFRRDASFEKIPFFKGNAKFYNSEFVGDAQFWFSEFNSDSDFDYSVFKGDANFDYSTFNGDANFRNSEFKGYASFRPREFKSDANFDCSVFNGIADFSNLKINGTASFMNSTFISTANFRNSNFSGEADFTATQFKKEGSFDDSQFNGATSFNNSRFEENALFEGTDFNNCRLYLKRAKYDKLYIRWINISKSKLDYDETSYLLLIKNFRNLGFFEDADECYYQYRKESLPYVWPPYQLGDAAALILYGYGVKPLYPLFLACVSFLLFGLFYWIKDLGFSPEAALKFSAIVLLSGTGPFLSISSDLSKAGKYKNWAHTEKILGRLFFVLFLIAFGKAILREVI